jgi:RNA polymerase sigma-70 factor (ECF subfamily)
MDESPARVFATPFVAAKGEPDRALLDACARGERDAFAVLFEGCKDRVFATALRLSGDPTEAADITQDVFLKVLTRIRQYRNEARFGTWLHRIVVNTFLDARKGRPRVVPLDEEGLPHRAALHHDPTRPADLAHDVARALARVDVAFRVPLVLRYVSGLSYAEIGETLDLPPGTVASRISRGLRDLGRALLPPEGA